MIQIGPLRFSYSQTAKLLVIRDEDDKPLGVTEFSQEAWAEFEAATASGPKPGEIHPVDKAFHDVTVKERDLERVRVDRLTRELAEARDV